ncbi:MAG: SpoIID/LytB domain-containing protein, partial [Clostridia bacterium]|nr:SpoIID/LytB domain-containing protein [Clostridia bacterium]
MYRQRGWKWTKQYLLRLLAVVIALTLPTTAIAQGNNSHNGLVRVRLSSLGTLNSVTLNLQGDYSANNGQISLPQGTQAKVGCNASTGQLTLSMAGQSWNMGEYFTLNRCSSNDSATIVQASGNSYPADFSFRAEKKGNGYYLLLIAHIQIEDYLYGVLPYEMGNSAPLEALKAQAVAARTYTVRMMDNRAGNVYDVVDTTADQLYKGTPAGNTNCKTAVDATAGVVLKYGDRYAETYYCSSNGGQTEAAQNIWGGKGYHYLPVTDDPYDLASGAAKTKTATIYKDLQHGSNRQAFLQILKEKTVSCLKRNGYASTLANTQLLWLEKLTLHTPKYASPSKLYTKADFTLSVETVAGGGGSVQTSVVVTADVFGELEGPLGLSVQSSSNEIWTVSSNDTAYTLKAGRYGHGVGMSQYGAMEMARQGFSYDAILGFYYPGCATVRQNFSDSPMNDAGLGILPETQPSATDSSGNMADINGSQSELGYATVIANGFVNLRQSPSLSASILGVAMEGEMVKVLFLENQWAFVEYNGTQAYAMRKLLSDVKQMEQTPEKDDDVSGEAMGPADDPSEQPSFDNANQAMVFCTDGFVNFRETPSLSGRILMQLPHGAYLDVLQTEGEFSHVAYMGIEGYVMNAFLVKGDPFGSAAPVPQPQPTVTPEQLQTNEPPTLA